MHRKQSSGPKSRIVSFWLALSCLSAFLLLGQTVSAGTANLSKPLMGWSTWESFAKGLSEDKILANLDVLTRSGLRAKGYRMVQVDDGWMRMDRSTGWIARENYTERSSITLKKGIATFSSKRRVGCMLPDLEKFPDGMKTFGERVKARGFQYGLYTSGEDTVCDSDPTFKGFYASTSRFNLRSIDAKCFIDWGVDLMKIDMCNAPTRSFAYSEQAMRAWRALLPRDVIIYNSRYGCLAPVKCGRRKTGGNIYRCPHDVNFAQNRRITPYCHQTADIARASVDMKPHWPNIMAGIRSVIGRGAISRPGFWSDPDYLVPHPEHLSFREARSQFSAWCIMSAPLLISTDITKVSDQTLEMLGNTNAIRVNQEYYSGAGDLLYATGVIHVFRKRLSATEFALLILHAGKAHSMGKGPKTDAAVKWSPGSLQAVVPPGTLAQHSCKLNNIWQNGGSMDDMLFGNTTFTIEARDSVFLIVSGCQ